MKPIKDLWQSDWAISIAVHLIILFAFSLVLFEAPRKAVETVVDLFTEPYSEFEPVKADPGLPAPEQTTEVNEESNPEQENVSPAVTKEKAAQPANIAKETKAEAAPVTKTDPVLPPANRQTNTDKPSGTVPSSSFLTKLKGKLRGAGDGGSSYELDNGDGSITVLSKVLPTTTVTDYGKVSLQFKIKADGSVAGESIIPVLVDDANYTRDAVSALKQWKFEVKRFNANQIYKITFIFKPI